MRVQANGLYPDIDYFRQ